MSKDRKEGGGGESVCGEMCVLTYELRTYLFVLGI